MKKIVAVLFSLVAFAFAGENVNIPINKKDAKEIVKLIRNTYAWVENSRAEYIYIGVPNKENTKYIGIDWNEYAKNEKLLKQSGYFSNKFIASYENLLKYIDNRVKKGLYKYEWEVGMMPILD